LKALREMALIQNVESSNRIEGVTVAPERLVPLVVGKAKPGDRSEEGIRGYRRSLILIHTDAQKLEVTPDFLRRIHETTRERAADAGQWKQKENEIVEFRENAPPTIRFRPVFVVDTPGAVEELCLSYRATLNQQEVQPLVSVSALVFDFLCIHPFRDCNGRMSRLLTLLGLYHDGYEVGRFISLQRLVEESGDDYYEALGKSSEGWHEGRHDLIPWLNYFPGVLRRGSVEFEQRAGVMESPRGAKTVLVETAVDAFPREFTLGELERACPGVSRGMVRRVLGQLQKKGRLAWLGRGPSAYWRRKGASLGAHPHGRVQLGSKTCLFYGSFGRLIAIRATESMGLRV
jgi:Fic family protein